MAKTQDEVSGGAVQHNEAVVRLQEIPNVGPRIAADLIKLGVTSLEDVAGRDPDEMYHELCAIDAKRHDPCVRDVFAAVVSHAEGGPARPWWEFTPERKARDAQRGRKLEGRGSDEVWLRNSLGAGSKSVGQRKRANTFRQAATT